MTRIQALAIAILSVWLGWTLFMWFLAGRSFRTADRVLTNSNPQVADAARPLAAEKERELLRHVASEINRTIFGAYGWAQVVLGAVLLVLFLKQMPRDNLSLVLAVTMLGLVLVLTLAVTPQIASLGRSLDFVPRTPPPPEFKRFWMLHGAFTGLDGFKLLAGLFLLGRLILRK
ncbi:MAG TPA: DUF4149 domain-containing protein [Terriglobia bacterium]|nr:DUF4149 domain-containing protein [Terriglobia bacterium]